MDITDLIKTSEPSQIARDSTKNFYDLLFFLDSKKIFPIFEMMKQKEETLIRV